MSDSSPPIYPDLLNQELEPVAKRFMVPGERLVIVVRHHLAMIIIPILICVAAVLLAIAVDVFSTPEAGRLRDGVWGIALVAFLYMSWYVAHWRNDYLIVTNKRLMHTSGLITKSVLTLPLGKVNDMTLERDPLGRIFGYGRFKAESAGKDPLGRNGLAFISRPEETYLEISNLMYGPGAKSAKEPQEVRLVGAVLPDLSGEPVEIVLPPVSVKSPADDDKVHPVNAAMVPVRVWRDEKGQTHAFETDVTTARNKRRRIRFLR